MAEITAAMVKELREKTDAPMMECKKALTEAAGDMARAEEILRVKLGSKASKAASRVTAAAARNQDSASCLNCSIISSYRIRTLHRVIYSRCKLRSYMPSLQAAILTLQESDLLASVSSSTRTKGKYRHPYPH